MLVMLSIRLNFLLGSFLEFLPMLSLLKEEYSPSDLPCHLIVPSLPGYAFSSGPPLHKDFGFDDIARVMDRLMIKLGFEDGYIAQGGDIGSGVSRVLGGEGYPSCRGSLHAHSHSQPMTLMSRFKFQRCTVSNPSPNDLRFAQLKTAVNMTAMGKPEGVSDELTPKEVFGLQRIGGFLQTGFAYAQEHGTRPSTIGHVLSTNPVAILAWSVSLVDIEDEMYVT
jgi:microsomal epoxide hydrolase